MGTYVPSVLAAPRKSRMSKNERSRVYYTAIVVDAHFSRLLLLLLFSLPLLRHSSNTDLGRT
jgi:hypothetical protein